MKRLVLLAGLVSCLLVAVLPSAAADDDPAETTITFGGALRVHYAYQEW